MLDPRPAPPMEPLRLRRILIALPASKFGGSEAHTLGVAEALAAEGMEVVLASGVDFAPFPRPPGVIFCQAALAWSPGGGGSPRQRQAAALEPLLARYRPDLLVLPLPWPVHGLGLMDAAAAAGLPVLLIAHLVPPSGLPPLDQETLRMAAALPAEWLAVSTTAARRMERLFRLPAGRVRTIPNGVPIPTPATAAEVAARQARLRAELGVGEKQPVALFAGRLAEAKGADLLPGIARAFHAACGGVIACAGEGALRPQLDAAGEGALRMLGFRTDVPDLLLGADALLLPSRAEGYPLIFLEAAARRRPVVASPIALECLGPQAGAQAILPTGPGVKDYAAALARAVRPEQAAPRVEAAWRNAVGHDRTAMLAAYRGAVKALYALHAQRGR